MSRGEGIPRGGPSHGAPSRPPPARRRIGTSSLQNSWQSRIKDTLPNLQKLDLGENALDTLPAWISDFPKLRSISIKSNLFTVFPESLLQATRLTELVISDNKFTSLPEGISAFKHLKVLDLSDCTELTSLPNGICDLTSLQRLKAPQCSNLETVPDDFGELSQLQELDLSGCSLQHLPESMGALSALQYCDLSKNHLQRIPPTMGYISTLRDLKLEQNDLSEAYRQAALGSGMSGLLNFLRKEDERERQEEIERNKPVGKLVGGYTEYKLALNTKRTANKRFISRRERAAMAEAYNAFGASDNRCFVRTGSSAVVSPKYMAVVGGLEMKSNSKTITLFLLNLETLSFNKIEPQPGDQPPPRDGHSLIYDEAQNQLVLFGGKDAKGKRLNDVWTIDLETFMWQRRSTDGPPPGIRENASAAYMADTQCMVIFGGKGSPKLTNDLYMLDLVNWTWFKPGAAGAKPPPRRSAAMCVTGQYIFVHGGQSNFVQDDLYAYDTKTLNWVQIETTGRNSAQRHKHIMTSHEGSLYIFGGFDDMGSAAAQMHRMPIPPDLSPDYLMRNPPEYEELDSMLTIKRNRFSAFTPDGILHLLQVGAGVEDESVEVDSIWYDCYKFTRLGDLKQKDLGSDTSEENAKRARVEHLRASRLLPGTAGTTKQPDPMPESYLTVSPKEERMIGYAQTFQRTFGELYPHRRPLFISPPNEAGTNKLVCTTLRPTIMPFPSLWEYGSAAHFVSEFIRYEPLEDPVACPRYLPSPASVIAWQAGDSFDMSTLLCSMLLGVGYNAYVVVGYAPRDVTLNNQSNKQNPLLKAELEKNVAEEEEEEDEAEALTRAMSDANLAEAEAKEEEADEVLLADGPVEKYQIRDAPDLSSKYQAMLEAQRAEKARALAAEEEERLAQAERDALLEEELARAERALEFGLGDDEDRDGADPHKGKRVHAWVLLLPKKRGVTTPTFIEPTTGECFSMEDCPYDGVEFVWNNQNFWVCMQQPEPHSDSRAHPAHIKWDLANPQNWEFLLSTAEDILAEPEIYPGGGEFARRSHAALLGDGAEGPGGGGPGLAEEMDVVAAQRAAAAAERDGWMDDLLKATSSGAKDRWGQVLDMPTSWVPRMTITRDAFDTRCPRGHKVTMYDRCKAEVFAYFGECAKAYEGRVERLTFFSDQLCTMKTEMWEFFQRRADKLKERREYVTEDRGKKGEKLVEHFDEGSSFALKSMISIRGSYRETHYWTEGRLDGLVKRIEEFDESEHSYLKWLIPQAFIPRVKITEWFRGRDDRLVYRSARYQPVSPEEMLNKGASKGVAGGAGLNPEFMRVEHNQPIVKITEKFERNPDRPAEEDVAKRRFKIGKEDVIEVHYHYGDGKITQGSKVFTHGLADCVQVDPLAPPIPQSQLAEEYQRLAQDEKEAMAAIREVENEIRDMMVRREEEDSGGVHVPYYDVIRENQEESDADNEEEEVTEYDYLAPYLPADYHPRRALTTDEAKQVRQKCLDALKLRLLRREAIIRTRLDEETANLTKKQQTFTRDRDNMSREEEEEHEREVEEALFKLQILDQRKRRHDEEALMKFYDLDQTLKKDPRLAPLLRV